MDGSDAVARVQAPAVAGVGHQPVSIGTLPTRVPATQPGPRVGDSRPDRPVREAVPVDGDPEEQAAETVRQLRALSTPEGATALSLAFTLLTDGADAVSAL